MWLTSSVTSTACKHCSMTAEDRLFIKLYELKKAERPTECLLKCLGALHRLVLHHLIMDTEHVKQVLNSCLDMVSQELVKDVV